MAHDTPDVGWYVHFGRLAAATEGAGDTAGSLRRRTNELGPGCVAAASAHGGMASAAALAACHGRFSDHLHGHATEIFGISEQLADNHKHYSRAERDSEDVTHVNQEV
jgi:hypothetical protein